MFHITAIDINERSVYEFLLEQRDYTFVKSAGGSHYLHSDLAVRMGHDINDGAAARTAKEVLLQLVKDELVWIKSGKIVTIIKLVDPETLPEKLRPRAGQYAGSEGVPVDVLLRLAELEQRVNEMAAREFELTQKAADANQRAQIASDRLREADRRAEVAARAASAAAERALAAEQRAAAAVARANALQQRASRAEELERQLRELQSEIDGLLTNAAQEIEAAGAQHQGELDRLARNRHQTELLVAGLRDEVQAHLRALRRADARTERQRVAHEQELTRLNSTIEGFRARVHQLTEERRSADENWEYLYQELSKLRELLELQASELSCGHTIRHATEKGHAVGRRGPKGHCRQLSLYEQPLPPSPPPEEAAKPRSLELRGFAASTS